MDLDAPTLINLLLQVAGGIGALIAFLFSYRQYKKGQTWRKARVILSLIDSFEQDKRIELACEMIDWDERDLVVNGKRIHFKNDMLLTALRTPKMDTGFSEEETIIRDAFDAFFDFFHKLYSFQEGGLLEFSDFVYFYYWFELICNIGKYKQDERIQQVIDNYIDTYNFIGFKKLIEEYKKRKPCAALRL